jgi:hypothetical protein
MAAMSVNWSAKSFFASESSRERRACEGARDREPKLRAAQERE